MKKNLAAIMTRAHALTRASLQPGDCYAVNLAAGLKIAWAEDGLSPREIFESWTESARYDYLMRMAGYEYKHDDARTIYRNGERVPAAPVFTWVNPQHLADDLRAVAHDAYIRLYTVYFDNPAKDHMSLQRMTSRAIIAAAQGISRAERRNACALRHTVNDDGTELNILDISARGTAEPIAPGPETAAILQDRLRRAIGDDPRDIEIARLAAAGLKGTEIAARLGISAPAVTKRRIKMRERYEIDD